MPLINENAVFCLVSNSTDGNTAFSDISESGLAVTGGAGVRHDTEFYFFSPTAIRFAGSGRPPSYPLTAYLLSSGTTEFNVGTGDVCFEFVCKLFADWYESSSVVAFECVYADSSVKVSGYYSFGSFAQFFAAITDGTNTITLETRHEDRVAVASSDHHIAVVRESGVWNLYFDGVLVDSETDTFSFNLSSDDVDLYIGAESLLTAPTLEGYLDQFVIWSEAHYTDEFTPNTEPYGVDGGNYVLPSCQVNSSLNNPIQVIGFINCQSLEVKGTAETPIICNGDIGLTLPSINAATYTVLDCGISMRKPVIDGYSINGIRAWGNIIPKKISVSGDATNPPSCFANIVMPKAGISASVTNITNIIMPKPVLSGSVTIDSTIYCSGDVVMHIPKIRGTGGETSIVCNFILPKIRTNGVAVTAKAFSPIKYHRG